MGEIRSLLDRILELERELDEALQARKNESNEKAALQRKMRELEGKLHAAGRAQSQMQALNGSYFKLMQYWSLLTCIK